MPIHVRVSVEAEDQYQQSPGARMGGQSWRSATAAPSSRGWVRLAQRRVTPLLLKIQPSIVTLSLVHLPLQAWYKSYLPSRQEMDKKLRLDNAQLFENYDSQSVSGQGKIC